MIPLDAAGDATSTGTLANISNAATPRHAWQTWAAPVASTTAHVTFRQAIQATDVLALGA